MCNAITSLFDSMKDFTCDQFELTSCSEPTACATCQNMDYVTEVTRVSMVTVPVS